MSVSKQSFGWVAAAAADVRASYPEAVAKIEAQAISTERVRIEEWFTDAANDEASELLSVYLNTRGSE